MPDFFGGHKNIFEQKPELLKMAQDFIAAQKAEEDNTDLPELPTFQMGTGTVTELKEFTEEKLDDGAKARLKKHSIVNAYRQWFNPKDMRDSGDGNYITNCFNTNGHSNGDSHPSLCLKECENVYICYGCGIRGDNINLSAAAHGVSVDGTLPGDSTHVAVMEGCKSLFPDMTDGWKQVGSSSTWIYDPAPTVDPSTIVMPSVEEEEENEEEASYIYTAPELDWRSMDIPVMQEYMNIAITNNSPEEYNFMLFMQLMGMCASRYVQFRDHDSVKGNIVLLVVGGTGTKKSTAYRVIRNVYLNSLYFDTTIHNSTGVRIINNPGSGETVFKNFRHEIANPNWVPPTRGQTQISNIPKMLTHPGIDGLVYINELAGQMKKTKDTSFTDQLLELADSDIVMGGSSISNNYEASHGIGSVFTSIQGERARDIFTNSDLTSGFLNRIAPVLGTIKEEKPFYDPIDLSSIYPKVTGIRNWAKDQANIFQGGRVDAKLIWFENDAARDHYVEFFYDKITPKKKESPIFTRADLFFRKFLLQVAVSRREPYVSKDCIDIAIKIWNYLIGCQEILTGSIMTSQGDQLENLIDKVVRDSMPDGITRNELKKKTVREAAKMGMEVDREIVDKKIKYVDNVGEFETPKKPGQRGPAKKIFMYKPFMN